jgi:hypothetical protein
LVDTSVNGPERRYRFVRWAGQRDADQAVRPLVTGLPMRTDYTVTAAFAVQYPVTARFVDQQGQSLDSGRVSVMTVRSSTGQVLNLPSNATVWLDAWQPTYSDSVLSGGEVSYSLERVVIDGGNVVDAGRQRFRPAEGATVTVTAKLYDLTITAHDALFHSRLGTEVVITNPDGTRRVVAFDRDHSATLEHLPRGTYHVVVRAGSGVVSAEQLVLSRTRTADPAVVNVRDQVTIAAAVVAWMIGLLLAGRAHWRRSILAPATRRLRLFRAMRTLRRLARQAQRT